MKISRVEWLAVVLAVAAAAFAAVIRGHIQGSKQKPAIFQIPRRSPQRKAVFR